MNNFDSGGPSLRCTIELSSSSLPIRVCLKDPISLCIIHLPIVDLQSSGEGYDLTERRTVSGRVAVKSQTFKGVCARVDPVQCVRPVVDGKGVDTGVIGMNN